MRSVSIQPVSYVSCIQTLMCKISNSLESFIWSNCLCLCKWLIVGLQLNSGFFLSVDTQIHSQMVKQIKPVTSDTDDTNTLHMIRESGNSHQKLANGPF